MRRWRTFCAPLCARRISALHFTIVENEGRDRLSELLEKVSRDAQLEALLQRSSDGKLMPLFS
ncbi:putative NADH dehydrogenase/NAD domain protein, partial [Candidatus Erwinia dacicola]